MYISIDVGATHIRIAGTKSLEKSALDFLTKVDALDSYEEDLENIADALKHIENVEAIAVGMPGRLNGEKTQSLTFNLKTWFGRNLKADFEKKFGCKVVLENDAALAAMGEGMYGNGKNKNFIFIIWGTGVGGARVEHKDGKVIYFPLEPGHDFVINGDGRVGSCGHVEDLESYAGGRSIEMHYGKTADKLLEEEWNEVISYFSKGIKLILQTYPSDLIIFGGGVAMKQEDKVKRMESEVQREFSSVKLITSSLGEEAALYGGFALLTMEKS